jgi:WD40 repeat protein
MDTDGRTLLTGGGTSGEGLKIWDLRNLKEPKMSPSWFPFSETSEPTINSARFVPGMGIVIAACSDDVPVKLFNTRDEGAIMKEYGNLARSSYTVDVT